MINVNGEKAKQRVRAEMERRWLVFEKAFMTDVLSILRKQYKAAAENIESYEFNYNFAVDKFKKDLTRIYNTHYKRVLRGFGEGALDETSKFKGFENYQKKSFIDEFWRFALPWINQNTANKVVEVTDVTKRSINRIVKRGMSADKTNVEIAKEIRGLAEIALPFRANRIARTETHSAANYGIDSAMETSRLMKEKGWVSALDERTRSLGNGSNFDHVGANGERVAMNDTFKKTGENLQYPGDMSGSAGNIINCRCVALYYTDVKVQRGGAAA